MCYINFKHGDYKSQFKKSPNFVFITHENIVLGVSGKMGLGGKDSIISRVWASYSQGISSPQSEAHF